MEDSPAPWFSALRHSHDVLRTTVEPLTTDQLRQRSYAAEWSIAQVLSHLGSQAEIFGLFLDAGLSGGQPPGPEAFGPIWNIWNNKPPEAQATDALRADQTTLERFESLTSEQQARLRLQAFGRDLDVIGLARMRLSEHAVHTWDVVVALDPNATLAPDAVDLLVDTLGPMTRRATKPDGQHRELLISTSDPARRFILQTGDTVELTAAELTAAEDGEQPSDLRLPAEALIRLFYGRLDADHTPPVDGAGTELEQLRNIFPGF
jgi:uncharacterized protein (TIGR03083 family)